MAAPTTTTDRPQTTTLSEFAERVGDMSSRTYDSRLPANIKAAWRDIDTVGSARAERAELVRHRGALEIGIMACSGSVEVARPLRVDLAYTLAELPGHQVAAREQIGLLLGDGGIPKVDFSTPEATFTDEDCGDMLTRLSLRATYARTVMSAAQEKFAAGQIDQAKLDESITLARKVLGDVVRGAVPQLQAMTKMHGEKVGGKHKYDDDTRGYISGRTFELMRFTYLVAEWYHSAEPTKQSVRFASGREDRPRTGFTAQRRGFDIVVRHAGGVYLEQDKTSKSADANYDPAITVVTPKGSIRALLDGPADICEAFGTVVSPSATPKQLDSAWQTLDRRIGG